MHALDLVFNVALFGFLISSTINDSKKIIERQTVIHAYKKEDKIWACVSYQNGIIDMAISPKKTMRQKTVAKNGCMLDTF